jgi:hypothetical protein
MVETENSEAKTIDQPQNVENKNEAKQATSPDPKGSPEEPKEDPNWRAFREARKKDRAERQEAERRAAEKEAEAEALKAAMEAAFANKPAFVPGGIERGNGEEETEDAKIERKVAAALEIRERQWREMETRREREEYPVRLSKNFPDFNSTIAQENLDYLDYHYPEVSRPLQRLADGYEKWSDIYHAVKKFVPNLGNAKKDAAKIDSNQMKPKSISTAQNQEQTTGRSLESTSDIEKRRAARYEEMKRIINGVG